MQALAEQILEFAAHQPEGVGVTAKSLLHLGSRAAVDQALARLTKRGQLMRAGRGLYVRPVESRFGTRPPTTESLVERLSEQRGETVVASGAAEANSLGLTTQVPMRKVYLTSGRTRRLTLGLQTVELRHAPAWQLLLPRRAAGAAVRAMSWAGPERAHEVVNQLKERLPESEIRELVGVRSMLPTWMAREVSALVARG